MISFRSLVTSQFDDEKNKEKVDAVHKQDSSYHESFPKYLARRIVGTAFTNSEAIR
jgi:hypothetical protein